MVDDPIQPYRTSFIVFYMISCYITYSITKRVDFDRIKCISSSL
jgi:hypothetical protein